MTRPLFDIGADLEALFDLLEERNGDISDPDVESAVDGWFAELAADEAVKLDNCYGAVRTLESDEAVLKAEAEQYAKRATAKGNAARRLKERVKLYLELSGRAKAVTATGRVFAVQANGGTPPVVYADGLDVAAVPDRFVRETRAVDRDAVRDALLAGEELGWARFGPRGSQLRIR